MITARVDLGVRPGGPPPFVREFFFFLKTMLIRKESVFEAYIFSRKWPKLLEWMQ